MHSKYKDVKSKLISAKPLFIYDGGCPFCKYFAELVELKSGIDGLNICDGRSDQVLARYLAESGFSLRNGAVLLVEGNIFYGDAAIHWLCLRMNPSTSLLKLISSLMGSTKRAKMMYPLLLFARRMALFTKKLPLDPHKDY